VRETSRLLSLRLLHEVPAVLERYQETWKFLNIDEYQDTNHAQYLLVNLLAKKYENLCAIGDPDQSIYAFRGADIRNILEFKRDYPKATTISLEQNYRSTQPILSAANNVIAVNPNRPEKNMWSEKKEGPKITLEEVGDEKMEAEHAIKHVLTMQKKGTSLNNQVILYRTNAQSRQFEEACLRNAVPYRIVGGLKFYMRREVKDVLAYLYTILNPQDTISLLRIINVPSRKIGQTTLLKLKSHCQDRGLNLWQGLLHIEMVEGLPEATKQKLSQFTQLILDLQLRAKEVPVSQLMQEVLDRIGMEKWVRDETEEGEERWQNIEELVSVARKYESLEPWTSLTSFLEEVALVSEVDKLDQVRDDALTLMTVHLCKGLEFESVMIAGAEEGIFPVSGSLFDREQLEEERRLMYVAMTRAKKHLRIMHARSRILWGNTQSNARSRFLDDIPSELVENVSDNILSRFSWGSSSKKKSAIEPFRQTFDQSPWGDDMNQDHETDLEPGTRINHPTFGTGTIKSVRGDILEVEFESGKTKHLASNIAPISLAP
jgi:DNA helicase-2/ATP-dependent DNA helicase PcrA